MAKNITHLLYVVSTLLGHVRHLAVTIQRRAAMPAFSLFATLFGAARLPVILAHLHRGVLRAAAPESLLSKRAAPGRGVEVAPLRARAAPSAAGAIANTDLMDEPLDEQIRQLTAERAKHDAPADTDHLPKLEQIETEVHLRPISCTVADMRRDLGVVPGLCTHAFRDAVMEAIAFNESSAADLSNNMHCKPEQFPREQKDDFISEQLIGTGFSKSLSEIMRSCGIAS